MWSCQLVIRSAQPARQLNVSLHNGHPLRMDCTQVATDRAVSLSRVEVETRTHASSNMCTRNASVASCSASIAELCHRSPASLYSFMSVIMSNAISRTCPEHQRTS